MSADPILDSLNPPQREAVTYDKGPLLVLAGAGSGKTRILTARIINLVHRGVPAYEILAVTFTNKAAQEMRHRIARQAGRSDVTVGTFHSVCLTILRACAREAGLGSDFTIYDDIDQLALIKTCMKELGIDEKKLNPKTVRERISNYKDYLKTPQAIEHEMGGYEDRLFFPVFVRYEQKLQEYNGVDFGDLIAKTVHLFLAHEEILSVYRERFKYILVDEYQDTNHAQYMFVNLLAKKYRQITVVGDPDQSIYEWRGANIKNILNFEKDYDDAKVVRLEQNYRSTNTILKAANALIAHNVERKSKNLWSENGEGEPIELYRAFNERDEARYVATQVLLYRHAGNTLKDLVCFYRIHAQSRVIEEELRRNNIPYKIIGGVKFYARKEIKDILAYLRVIANPTDELSLRRIINVPKRGVGEKALAELIRLKDAAGISLYAAIGRYHREEGAVKRLAKTATAFHALIERCRTEKEHVSLTQLVKYVLDESGYLGELMKEHTIEAKMRIENIEELANSIAEFEATLDGGGRDDPLKQYLEFISLQTGIDEWHDTDDVFTLMTLHCAKGLEFPVVFMVGLEEELLPHSNSLTTFSTRDLEEERRLCYVGITRAQKKLFLTYAAMRKIFGYERRSEPSRFLAEIPRELFAAAVTADIDIDDGDDIDLDFEDFYDADDGEYRRGRYGKKGRRSYW